MECCICPSLLIPERLPFLDCLCTTPLPMPFKAFLCSMKAYQKRNNCTCGNALREGVSKFGLMIFSCRDAPRCVRVTASQSGDDTSDSFSHFDAPSMKKDRQLVEAASLDITPERAIFYRLITRQGWGDAGFWKEKSLKSSQRVL